MIAVQEGRGVAKAAYYWPHQVNMTIESVDPMLLKIVQYLDPSVPSNVTYAEQFTGSTRMLFEAFATAQLELKLEEGISVELWANLEAFEYLRDAPCLPVDQVGDAMAEILDRTAKQRIDWGLTNQGALVNQIISFAWDSEYARARRPRALDVPLSLTCESFLGAATFATRERATLLHSPTRSLPMAHDRSWPAPTLRAPLR